MLDVTGRQGSLIVPECSDETLVSPGDQHNRRAQSADRLFRFFTRCSFSRRKLATTWRAMEITTPVQFEDGFLFSRPARRRSQDSFFFSPLLLFFESGNYFYPSSR